MFLNSKVSSFSMIEMLVTMILSSMVVGTIYMVYYTVNSYQVTLTKKYTDVQALNDFYFVTMRDFDRSDYVEVVNGNEVKCTVKGTDTKVWYSLYQDQIVRTQKSRTDTTSFVIQSVNFFMGGKEITNGLIDEVRMNVAILNNPVELVFVKQYDAAALINNQSEMQ